MSLLEAVVRHGAGDEQGVRRDVGALLAWLRAARPEEANQLVESVRQRLGDEAPLVALLDSAVEASTQLGPSAPFGPVAADTLGAAERLALFSRVARASGRLGALPEAADAFARASGLTPDVFRVAARVQELLGSNQTPGGLWWRDEFIPAALQLEWQNLQFIAAAGGAPLAEEWRAGAEWLRPWLAGRALAAPSAGAAPVDGFLRAQRPGHRPVAAHPLVLHLLRGRVLEDPDASDGRQFFAWLAGQASFEPETAVTAGGLVLEASSQKGVRVTEAGELQGEAFWVGLSRQIFDTIIKGSNTGADVAERWRGKHARLDELYRASVALQGPLFGVASGGEALLLVGQTHLLAGWRDFNEGSRLRAATVLTDAAGAITQSVARAKEARARLDSLMGNPLASPWLPRAGQEDPPKSLEAGAVLRWHVTQLAPRDLWRALDKNWKPLAADMTPRPPGESAQQQQRADAERLASLDHFSAWEASRGSWVAKNAAETAGAPPASPWQSIPEAALLAAQTARLSDWLQQPSRLPRDADFLSALSALCWFGPPAALPVKRLADAIDASVAQDTALTDADKLFLRACKLHLTLTSVLAGEASGRELADSPLLSENEVLALPQAVRDLYVDGRPFSVRAAAEATWMMGVRASAIQSPGSAEALVDRSKELRNTARSMLEQLNRLLRASALVLQQGGQQGGLGIALVVLEIDLNRLTIDLPASDRRQRKELIAGLSGGNLAASALGTGFWGADAWLGVWQQEVDKLAESRLLTVSPVVFTRNRLRESHNRHLGALAAFLSGAPQPRRGQGEKSWQEPGLWINDVAPQEGASASAARSLDMQAGALGTVVTNVRLSSVPWSNAPSPAGMLKTLLERSSLLASRTAKLTERVDIDGLNDQYLPRQTWASGQRGLAAEVQELRRIENEIREQNGVVQLSDAIRTLRPLLAAPLVVNLSAFRDELSAAVAEVRQAESRLVARKSESLAAELEVAAQQLLTRVYALERERTGTLEEIRRNEVRLADIGKSVGEKREEIARLQGDVQGNASRIAQLEGEVRQLEQEKGSIQVAVAARAVAAIQNQITLLEDLIYTPTPHPEFPNDRARDLPGQLGVLAFHAEQKVNSKLTEVNGRRDELKRHLDDLREASLIKGITKFIGAVVGFIIGGPGGAQMGALIGEAAGGVIAGIKQGKPVLEILEGTLQTGIQIAAAAGVDVKGEFKNLGSEAGELAQTLDEAQKVLGPLLRELPTYMDRDTLREALTVGGVSDPLRNVLMRIRDDSLTRMLAADLPAAADALVKSIPGVVLNGSPEGIRARLKDEALQVLRGLPVDAELRRAAAELGVVVEANLDEERLKAQMAEKVATLGIVRALPSLKAGRDRLVRRLMISLTSMQSALRGGSYTTLAEALNSQEFRASLPIAEYESQVQWLRRALEGVPVVPRREISWDMIQPRLREALKQTFPDDPERREFVLGRFQMQLDTNGMQAEIQRVLNPWNRQLVERMDEVERAASQPCQQDDDEERIECQIDVLNQAAAQLQGRVLNWLRDANSNEVVALKADLAAKKEKLNDANDNLQVQNLNLQQAMLRLQQAGLIKEQADLNVQIADLAKSVATLDTQQAGIVLQNANLELRRVRLQEEQDALRELAGQERATALARRLDAARGEVKAAQAALEGSLARARAARNRATVYGKVEGWYPNGSVQAESQALVELYKLREEHRYHVEQAGVIVRDLLRFLRVSGGDAAPFGLPARPNAEWSSHLENVVRMGLQRRYQNMNVGPGTVDWFEIPLTKGQIGQLFSDGGLEIAVEQQDENRVPTLRANKVDPNWYPIAPQARHERVFLVFLMAEDENNNVVDQTIWRRLPAVHDPVAPILEGEGAIRDRRMLLTQEKMVTELRTWGDRIESDSRMSQQRVFAHVERLFNVNQLSDVINKEDFQRELGMPLTGNYRFRVSGVPPQRAKLVLVFSRHAQL